MALTLTPSSRLDWQGLVIFASRRRRTVYFAVSTPHSTQANTGDLQTHEMNTRTDFLVARALCLSNPASKGRRWRRDASRAAILRLSQSFLTFVAAQRLLFLHPLDKHNTKNNNNNPTFVVVDTLLCICVFLQQRLLDVPFLSRLFVVQSLFSRNRLSFAKVYNFSVLHLHHDGSILSFNSFTYSSPSDESPSFCASYRHSTTHEETSPSGNNRAQHPPRHLASSYSWKIPTNWRSCRCIHSPRQS